MSEIKHLDYDSIQLSFRDIMEQAYEPLVPKDIDSLHWKGPLLTSFQILCSQFNTDESFREYKEYHKERGRDVFSVVIDEAFKLGRETTYRQLAIEPLGGEVTLRVIERALENPEDISTVDCALSLLKLLRESLKNPGGVK
jgi:hypothetical protein